MRRPRSLWTARVALISVLLAATVLAVPPGSPRSPGASSALPVPAGSAAPRALAAPLATAAQGQLVVNTSDALSAPNDGLEMNVTAYPGVPLAADSSFQVAATEVVGAHDAVFGIFANTVMAPTAFFAVYSNSSDANEHLAYWPGFLLVPGSGYLFTLADVNGSTVWSLTVNGQLFGGNSSAADFDFGANRSTWVGGISFSETALYPTTPTAPMVLTVPLAFAVHRPSGWYLPDEGRTYFRGSGGPPWGVEGRLQHPSLAPGEIVSGTSIPLAGNGTPLWLGGPVPVRAAISVAGPSSVGLSNVAVGATVTAPNGVPIPGVALTFTDRYNGSFTPATTLTNTTGAAFVSFATPNVSVNVTDLVTVQVTTFGYLGSAGATIAISPAPEVTIRAPARVPLSPTGSASITFGTWAADGAPLAGVGLVFDLVGLGSILPSQGVTDATGSITVGLALPPGTPSATVVVRVVGNGVWGQGTFTFTFGAPPTPSLLERYGTPLAEVALAAIAVTVAGVAYRRYRRGRRALPAMPVRRYWKEIRPPRGPPPPPISRTPP